MLIGERLRQIREDKKLSQGDVEKATGLLRCYISRVENGHTVPSVETLEKLARGMDVPMYQLFYDGTEPPAVPKIVKADSRTELWGANGKPALFMRKLTPLLAKAGESDRKLVYYLAQKLSQRNGRKTGVGH